MLLLVVVLCSCEEEKCYINNYFNVTSYEVEPTNKTPMGIKIDDPLGLLDVHRVDTLVMELEDCLGIRLKVECITIKVPLDIYKSPCTGVWLFECVIDPQLCIDKGLIPTSECPCNCRSAIQDDNVIVVTPTLETLKGELTRLMTGISNPWIYEDISVCL